MSQKRKRTLPSVVSLDALDSLPAQSSAGSSQSGKSPSVRAGKMPDGTPSDRFKTTVSRIIGEMLSARQWALSEGSSVSLYAPDEKGRSGTVGFLVNRGPKLGEARGRVKFEEVSDLLNSHLMDFAVDGIEITLPAGMERLEQCRFVGTGQGSLRLAPVPVDQDGNI